MHNKQKLHHVGAGNETSHGWLFSCLDLQTNAFVSESDSGAGVGVLGEP